MSLIKSSKDVQSYFLAGFGKRR